MINLGAVIGPMSPPAVSGAQTIVPPTLWTSVSLGYTTTIQLGDSAYLKYALQEGKRYHVFLVGNWSETHSSTDYDVYVSGPSRSYSFTEASGLPEQVFTDGRGV